MYVCVDINACAFAHANVCVYVCVRMLCVYVCVRMLCVYACVRMLCVYACVCRSVTVTYPVQL